MKNLRNLFTAFTLVAVMTFGSTFANAGLLISDAPTQQDEPCTDKGGFLDKMVELAGIIITSRNGIIITSGADKDETCGIIITSKSGKQVSSNGLLISD